MTERDGPEGWVLYDAGCGVCSRAVPPWSETFARVGLGVRALQDPWVIERLALDEPSRLRDIRILFADGRQLAGADVYRYVLRRRWWGYPLHLLSIAPGMRWLVDAAYRAFADRRQRISAACGLEPIDARR